MISRKVYIYNNKRYLHYYPKKYENLYRATGLQRCQQSMEISRGYATDDITRHPVKAKLVPESTHCGESYPECLIGIYRSTAISRINSRTEN